MAFRRGIYFKSDFDEALPLNEIAFKAFFSSVCNSRIPFDRSPVIFSKRSRPSVY